MGSRASAILRLREHSANEFTEPNKFEAGIARAGQLIATYLEIIAMLIVIAALVFGLSMTADGR